MTDLLHAQIHLMKCQNELNYYMKMYSNLKMPRHMLEIIIMAQKRKNDAHRKVCEIVLNNAQKQKMILNTQPFDATCIWFNRVTGEQIRCPKGMNPGPQYLNPYIVPR